MKPTIGVPVLMNVLGEELQVTATPIPVLRPGASDSVFVCRVDDIPQQVPLAANDLIEVDFSQGIPNVVGLYRRSGNSTQAFAVLSDETADAQGLGSDVRDAVRKAAHARGLATVVARDNVILVSMPAEVNPADVSREALTELAAAGRRDVADLLERGDIRLVRSTLCDPADSVPLP